MPTAELVSPARLNLDGTLFIKGKPKEVDFETAHVLKDNPRFKVAGLDTREAVEYSESLTKSRGADLMRAINEANDQLDIDDDDAFDRSGKPSVAALSKPLGYAITREERDAALNAIEKAPQAGKVNVDAIAAAAATRTAGTITMPKKIAEALKEPSIQVQ